MLDNWLVTNPKQRGRSFAGRINWYPYYAGFSTDFVQSILTSSELPFSTAILDPWNGSGTTTSVAVDLGYQAIGYDLNPVMVIACKARLLGKHQKSSLLPLAAEIVAKAKNCKVKHNDINEPLCVWLESTSASYFRNLERVVHKFLVNENTNEEIETLDANKISDIASFYYIGLFRTLRIIIQQFIPSNPTWIKRPKDVTQRLSPSLDSILSIFIQEIKLMVSVLESEVIIDIGDNNNRYDVSVASSIRLPLQNEIVDLIISSPPYCTRIDYAVATMAELAIIGYSLDTSFDRLRRELMGTSTVSNIVIDPASIWGETCNTFLNQIYKHSSKASKTYYHKNHVQYFNGIFQSISEIVRVLHKTGICVLVVQDSYYKDIHNDLPQIFIEMAENLGLSLARKEDFLLRQSMAGINPKVKKYRSSPSAVEAVLCFCKM